MVWPLMLWVSLVWSFDFYLNLAHHIVGALPVGTTFTLKNFWFWFWSYFFNTFQPEKFQLLPAPGSNRSKKGAKQQHYNGNHNSHHTNLEHRPHAQGGTANLGNLQPTYKRPSPAALASAAQAEERALATAELNRQLVNNEIQENNLLNNSPPVGGSPASTISDRFVPINFNSL